jgi:CheY-like chemotaxis protein
LERLANDRPTVALVDLRLPGMDGNAFIRRALPIRPSMICIICTGSPEYRMPEDLVEHPRVSREIVTKPIKDLAALEAALKQLIQRYNEEADESE